MSGIAIAIAWPSTLCKQTSAWYEPLMKATGFNINGYYRVGHAAVLLLEKKAESLHYFDFGRYHAPEGKGRVRSIGTDHDLSIGVKPIYSNDDYFPINISQILNQLYGKYSYHGTGPVYATVTKINFKKAFNYASSLQSKEFLNYGPFIINGTNCSRFVRSVLLAGLPFGSTYLKILLPWTLTPTPLGIVKSMSPVPFIYKSTFDRPIGNVPRLANTVAG